ncbi:MAG TPA: C39 family peptidase, partial [Elusimicrobiales bacterium]|nr:C39 family peptidase [Elusimicrobiales bacterium]
MNAHAKTKNTTLPRSATVVHFLPGDFKPAAKENLEHLSLPEGVFRVKNTRRAARLTSAGLPALFPFDQLLVSAAVLLPRGGTLQAEARVKTAAGWSPWFSFGRFTKGKGGASVKSQANRFGKLDVDVLKLAQKASAFRYRLTIPPCGAGRAVIKLAAASYTDSAAPYAAAAAVKRSPDFGPLKLKVRPYSQMVQKVPYARDICSPVSLAMALTRLGRPTGPLQAAALVRDSAENIYGNWFFNTAFAGSEGFYSFLTRLNSLEEARLFIAAGIPVIASVTFAPGELNNSPLEKTRGHLLVIKGFDAAGNVIVNDPAAPAVKSVERVYDRAQFAAAWLKNKYGTAYIVARDLNAFLAVKAPVTEFFSEPPGPGKKARVKLIESQLLANERVELIGISGGWARVKALEQAHLQPDKRTLAPYEGWLRLDDLAFSLPAAHTAVVRAKTALAGGRKFSMGVKFGPHAAQAAGTAAALPRARHLNALPVKHGTGSLRKNIIKTARLFLGDAYYWG